MGKGRCYADYADTVALLHALAHFAVLVRRVESSDQNGWNSPDRVVKRERRLPSLSLSHSLSHPLTRSFALIALRLFLHFIFLLFLCCFFFVAVFLLTFMRPAYHFVSSGRVGSGAKLRALLVPFHSMCTDLTTDNDNNNGKLSFALLVWVLLPLLLPLCEYVPRLQQHVGIDLFASSIPNVQARRLMSSRREFLAAVGAYLSNDGFQNRGVEHNQSNVDPSTRGMFLGTAGAGDLSDCCQVKPMC